MWKNVCDRIYENTPNTNSAVVVRIGLFDSEKAEKPFAEFEQLVGFCAFWDDNQPLFSGYN